MFLTKICMVSESSGDWDRELEMDEGMFVRLSTNSRLSEEEMRKAVL
tara:strand:+ start:859 stop:999 length:141 start_codon:yes stop_codon:yes gene_type:complete